jgi:hypothetical protein
VCVPDRTLLGDYRHLLLVFDGCGGRGYLEGVTDGRGSAYLDVGLAPNEIPKASVSIEGRDASWTHTGAQREAILAGPGGASLPEPPAAPKGLVRRCAKLKGPFVARSKSVKVVAVRRGGARVFRGCSPTSRDDTRVVTLARLRPDERFHVTKLGPAALTFDVRAGTQPTGRISSYYAPLGSYEPQTRYWSYDGSIDCGQDFRALSPPPVKTLLAKDRLVVVYSTGTSSDACYPNGGENLIVDYTVEGSFPLDVAPADQLPVASVRVSHGVVHWTHGGVNRHW